MKLERALIRTWFYIVRPFSVSKAIELLYMFNWIWYFFLSLLPEGSVNGTLFISIYNTGADKIYIVLFFMFMSTLSIIGLIFDIILIRKATLIINIGIITFLVISALGKTPIAGGIGYLIILGALTIFVFIRMDTLPKIIK